MSKFEFDITIRESSNFTVVVEAADLGFAEERLQENIENHFYDVDADASRSLDDWDIDSWEILDE